MSETEPGWGALLSGKNGIRSLTLAGGVALHAINVYIVVTILPSLVKEIGGENYYSWAATIFVTASLIGASLMAGLLKRVGPRMAYVVAALIFALGTFGCGFAPSMPLFLVGRLVQGFGGGLLLSLSYGMVRIVFVRALWPRALGIISGMWGIATLLGPAIGGIFAEYDIWRVSFWLVGCLAILFTVLAFVVLPANNERNEKTKPIPVIQLGILTVLVLTISAGSAMDSTIGKIGGLVLGLLLLIVLAQVDRHAKNRLLPSGSFTPSSQLFSIYVLMLSLSVAVNGAELFLPLFLQVLHHLTPLPAGYLAALMSIGWTCGSLPSAGVSPRRLPSLMIGAPLLCLLGMVILLFLIPSERTSSAFLVVISVGLFIIGIGSGIIWPHLLSRVLQTASDDDADLASASLTSVQLFATALSAAFAGTITNLAGLHVPGGTSGTINAARALFLSLVIILLIGLPFTRRISKSIRQELTQNS